MIGLEGGELVLLLGLVNFGRQMLNFLFERLVIGGKLVEFSLSFGEFVLEGLEFNGVLLLLFLYCVRLVERLYFKVRVVVLELFVC